MLTASNSDLVFCPHFIHMQFFIATIKSMTVQEPTWVLAFALSLSQFFCVHLVDFKADCCFLYFSCHGTALDELFGLGFLNMNWLDVHRWGFSWDWVRLIRFFVKCFCRWCFEACFLDRWFYGRCAQFWCSLQCFSAISQRELSETRQMWVWDHFSWEWWLFSRIFGGKCEVSEFMAGF